jgi:hypothetical protein
MPEISDWLTRLSETMTVVVAAAAVVLVVLVAAVWISRLRKRGRTADDRRPDLSIDLECLPALGPPAEGPRLELYGTPVRLAVVILAPSGRQAEDPVETELLAALDDLLPGLPSILTAHQPLVRCWPAQLSTQGFTNTFFQKVRLPGKRGKGTPWCSVAGRFETEDRQLLAGLVCRADKANSLSQIAIEHSGQWMDILRAKDL